MSDDEILLARRKLCFRLAETAIDICEDPSDVDELSKALESIMPQSKVELEAEMRSLYGICGRKTKPGHMARLREALGMDVGSVGEVIDEAARRIRSLPAPSPQPAPQGANTPSGDVTAARALELLAPQAVYQDILPHERSAIANLIEQLRFRIAALEAQLAEREIPEAELEDAHA